ncbi:hypothetical protein ID866_13087 [Astraeus odoratus]|nr:hypothetical protein ID866_13087 [Astraeus odoratus]
MKAIPAVMEADAPGGLPDIDSTGSYQMDPRKVRQQFECIGRFRILIMGRANADKTTILPRVCGATDLPEVFDGEGNKRESAIVDGSLEVSHNQNPVLSAGNRRQRGQHNIRDELVFQSNRGFIFHDSCGFEAGSEDEFEKTKDFVVEHSSATKVLHTNG